MVFIIKCMYKSIKLCDLINSRFEIGRFTNVGHIPLMNVSKRSASDIVPFFPSVPYLSFKLISMFLN